jgi:hypothetical protein
MISCAPAMFHAAVQVIRHSSAPGQVPIQPPHMPVPQVQHVLAAQPTVPMVAQQPFAAPINLQPTINPANGFGAGAAPNGTSPLLRSCTHEKCSICEALLTMISNA